ncbi:hypothetical protein PJW08_07935 [Tenacibaculum finnmarkense]|nr:hypothetical protein PJW08_07935 [Tenacibaculum finnmarkense]
MNKTYYKSLLHISFSILLFSNCSKEAPLNIDEYKIINKYQEAEENLTDDLSIATTNNNSFGKEIPGLSRTDKVRFASEIHCLINHGFPPLLQQLV